MHTFIRLVSVFVVISNLICLEAKFHFNIKIGHKHVPMEPSVDPKEPSVGIPHKVFVILELRLFINRGNVPYVRFDLTQVCLKCEKELSTTYFVWAYSKTCGNEALSNSLNKVTARNTYSVAEDPSYDNQRAGVCNQLGSSLFTILSIFKDPTIAQEANHDGAPPKIDVTFWTSDAQSELIQEIVGHVQSCCEVYASRITIVGYGKCGDNPRTAALLGRCVEVKKKSTSRESTEEASKE